ncbi:hypothetical protein D9615_009595 [Tricholomella constricta]|uniref:SH3 domain-containing protein n=1 Tax=Tricholomella constricta TaxID=117010 RepID=A0A8H5LW08_9AGAR|nr:hypothetical protein D9615_009595 [Tricholomella constricta]
MQVAVDTRRPGRQDTYDLREQIQQDDHSHLHAHADAASATYTDDEETSVMEDDSDGEDPEDYIDDDGSSSLSIPNESIDFDLVYSLHSFAATVEGQANVVKGDSLFLMDDSNSYWWLVRVLKTQEVGYIPAENIETPFERLARLNKHRNVDLASATQAELNENLHASQDRLRNNLSSRAGSNQTPSPLPRGGSRAQSRNVHFQASFPVHRYLPAIWKEDEEEGADSEWDDEEYEGEDTELADELMVQSRAEEGGPAGMEPDDGMDWEDGAVEEIQARQLQAQAPNPPTALQAGAARDQQQQQEQAIQQQRELAAQQQQQQAQLAQAQTLRTSSSRERLQDAQRTIDPLEATETRKLTVTPTIARSEEAQPYLPSAIMEKQQERIRDEEMMEDSRKRAKGKEKMAAPVSSASLSKPNSGGKLRKERDFDEDSTKDKKKKSVFGGLFGRKKDKKDKNASIGSLESGDLVGRISEDSTRSGHRPSTVESVVSPTTATAMQQQQQQQQSITIRASSDSKRSDQQQQPHTPERPPVSQHASQLRQRDQQQQALYQQQYLNRSPSSPPEAQPSYGMQSAPVVMPNGPSSYHSPPGSASTGLGPPVSKPRPGSLILTQSIMDGGGPGVPELSVIRVFAGKNLQTEATFKTVLLNSSTTSSELIRQATQRFRLSIGDEESEYYLTVKQVEGGASAVLRPEEKPLVVFEHLVVEAMEMPKVKRSSVGSISSVASNLSMHPAIKKLPMNDFTDDSAVKFYLNRKGDDMESVVGHGDEADETLIADSSFGDLESPARSQYLTVSTNHNVTPERFTSPSFRFTLQLVIYPDDLPDDMIFHPLTEAIVFKDTLREADAAMSPTVSPAMRRKVFVFPKNATVAEVIEIGLERFGISEGVVDGGDEIEDKSTKRRSSTRVRYGLVVDGGSHGHERELAPSSRVIDAFPRPPTFKAADRPTPTNKRRSVDSTLVLGSLDDVNPDDPVFILRRAISYRNSTYRHRMSAPLDELALHQLHRDSASSASLSDPAASPSSHEHKPSRQEIIARQREATRANQRAILSAQTNSVRGMDVLLPGNAMLRSSRYDVNDRMRYSYVDTDGETYDISDIVEEELRENNHANRNDLLEGVLGRKDVVGEKLNRVLSKIKSGKSKERDLVSLSSMDSSRRSRSISEYSLDDATIDRRHGARSLSPPGSAGLISKTPTDLSQTLPRAASAPGAHERTRSGTTTPTAKPSGSDRRHPSIASVMSDLSGYATPPTHSGELSNDESPRSGATPKPQQPRLVIPKDDFGIAQMLTIIEFRDAKPKVPLPPLHPVDELLFGRPMELQTLHPHVRDIYAPTFKQLQEMDKILDDYLGQALAVASH